MAASQGSSVSLAVPLETPGGATLLDSVLGSIVTPGAGPGLVATINGVLVILLLALLAFAWNGAADVHTAVIAFLALGLLGSVNYFILAVRAHEANEAEASESEDKALNQSPAPGEPAAALHLNADLPGSNKMARRRTQRT